ncbi:MAG: type II toxin-antitoxin system VapB family antitoxin [Candidatus Polarisedimenticolia bacterium]
MRTTIEISNELLRQAKKKAADSGVPLREVVEAALRGYLAPRRPHEKFRLRWRPAVKGKIQPGVNLDDRQSLWDLMDGRD